MARRTKKEVEQGTINIKYAPMNITGDTAFKCLNDDWGVVAFDIRRSQLENSSIQFGDKELQHNCLYFLMGRVGLTEMVYVGQAKKRNGGGYVLQRLREHAKSQTEPYREIWTRAIVVTGKEDTWGPTELNALEHIFYNEIPPENSLNGNNPNAGLDDLEQFSEKVKQIELYLAILKVGIFSGTDDSQRVTVQSVTNEYSRREDLLNGMARIPEIVTPHKTVVDIVDLLPADVWTPETTFLDPACKGGEFLKEIYDRLMETESLKAIYPNDIVRSNHILSNQIFGISISEVSKKRTTDSLNGFDPAALTPEDIQIVKEQYEILAKDMLRRQREGRPITFYHYMLDLTEGPCIYKRISGCGSGTEYMAVTPWGDLYPCHQFVGDEGYKLGNVWDGVTNNSLREEFRSCNAYARPECADCWAKLYCSGGCAANAYHASGSIRGIYEPGCELFKKRIECAIMMKVAEEEM